MDDLCVHSKRRRDHLSQLQLIFEKCQLYRLCLNTDKCVFMVRQGKILGHIVSANGISTDEDKIKVIVELPHPIHAKGECKSLWGSVDTVGVRGVVPRPVAHVMGRCPLLYPYIYL